MMQPGSCPDYGRNLSLASGEPATVGRSGTYTNWTGWTTTEAVTSFSPTSNNAAYSVLVQHAPTADAHYAITVSKSCGGGGAPKPPDLTDWYVE